LPEEEAAALRQAIAQDTELSRLHSQLKQAIGLVREMTASPEHEHLATSDALKLSPQRRAALHAAFKVIRPKELRKAASTFARREALAIAAMIVLLCLAAAIIAPNFRRARAQAQRLTVYGTRDESETEAPVAATSLARDPDGRLGASGRPVNVDWSDGAASVSKTKPRESSTVTVTTSAGETLQERLPSSVIGPTASYSVVPSSSPTKPEVPSVAGVTLPTPTPLSLPPTASDPRTSGERASRRSANIALPALVSDPQAIGSENTKNGWAEQSAEATKAMSLADDALAVGSGPRGRGGFGGGAAEAKPGEYAGVSLGGVAGAEGDKQKVAPTSREKLGAPTDSFAYAITPAPIPAGPAADSDLKRQPPLVLATRENGNRAKEVNLNQSVLATNAVIAAFPTSGQLDNSQFGRLGGGLAGGTGQTANVFKSFFGQTLEPEVVGLLKEPRDATRLYINGTAVLEDQTLTPGLADVSGEKKSGVTGSSTVHFDAERKDALGDLQRESEAKSDDKPEAGQRPTQGRVAKGNKVEIALPDSDRDEAKEKLRIATGPVVINEINYNGPATELPPRKPSDANIAGEEFLRREALQNESLREEAMKTVENAWKTPARLQTGSTMVGPVQLEEANLSQILDRYQELTGRTVLRPGTLPETRITLKNAKPLTRDEEIQALDSVLSLNGVTMTPQGGKFLKAVSEAQAGIAAAKVNDVPLKLLPESGSYVTQVVQLTNASADTARAALQSFAKAPNSILTIAGSGLVVLRDKPENVREMAEVLGKLEAAAAIDQKEQEAVAVRRASAPIPQPEVATTDNAFSTFSLNVSDVSFKLAAASLEKGQIPDPATVRSEEFINAFDYRDPEPKGSAPIAFAWERARYPFAHDRDLVRFSIKTAASGRQPGRPLNLVLLLDNSGSMERADRVRIRQECLRVLAGQLQQQDRVSVVAFARTARLFVDGLPGNQAGELQQRVGGLTPEGGTNLEDAMNVAYQTALRHFLANGVNRVVLLTDGAANLGDVEPASLKQKVEAHRRQGVALDCFGIGWEGLNDELLETLSRNGDGRYGFVNTPEAAQSEFASQLAGALQIAASDVKVQVEWNPRRVTAYRQIGYARHQLKKEQFRDNTVDAAEIGAAEAGNALYTVQVNPRGEGPLGTMRVRFKVPGASDYREHEWALPYEGAAKSLDQSGPALRLAASASAFSEWLVSSPFAAEVTPDKLLAQLRGVPEAFPADPRPQKLEWMIRQAKSVAGK
jgi:Mg-chelatase subunit ChlD